MNSIRCDSDFKTIKGLGKFKYVEGATLVGEGQLHLSCRGRPLRRSAGLEACPSEVHAPLFFGGWLVMELWRWGSLGRACSKTLRA